MDVVKQLADRIAKLETGLSSGGETSEPYRRNRDYSERRDRGPTNQKDRRPIICRKCGLAGHYARGCAAGRFETTDDESVSKEHRRFNISPVNPASAFQIPGNANGVPTQFLIDTGAGVSLLRKDVWDKQSSTEAILESWNGSVLVGVDGSPLDVLGTCETNISLRGEEFCWEMVVVNNLSSPAILGIDFLKSHQCSINLAEGCVCFPKPQQSDGPSTTQQSDSPRESNASNCKSLKVTLPESLRIPAMSEMEIMASVQGSGVEGTWVVEGIQSKKVPVLIAHALVVPTDQGVPVRLLNTQSEPVMIHRGTCIAIMESCVIPSETANAAVSTNDTNITTTTTPSIPSKEMLQKIVKNVSRELTDAQKEKLFSLLHTYSNILASSPSDLGHTKRLQHSIHTGEAAPVRQPVRRVPPHRREEIKDMLQDMQAKEIIQPSKSPWASPIVLVQKKNGGTRFCVDYRKLNNLTRKDAYPLPRVDDTLDTLAGSKWFTTLDLISGYWQVEMAPEDKEKTAFCTPEGLFEFNVMPFGLCNAPATFQRLMELILAGLQWSSCLVYIDDVIVLGRDFDDHLTNLQYVLERLQEAGLKLQPEKCHFCKDEVSYLGHIISRHGVSTDPSKTNKVSSWPQPTTKRDVQCFLGLANYYRRFIQGFAEIAQPLHKLTEKRDFAWTSQCQDAFEELRRKLTSTPILAFPDFTKPFILDTDASDFGIGAVLSQISKEGKEQVISYGSRLLTKAERRYCVTRRELLAVVTFGKQFRHYLVGKRFLLRTDHGSLSWLRNFKEPNGQIGSIYLPLMRLSP